MESCLLNAGNDLGHRVGIEALLEIPAGQTSPELLNQLGTDNSLKVEVDQCHED